MKYKLQFTKKAHKALHSCHSSQQERVISGLKNLVRFYNGNSEAIQPDIKKIKGKYKGLLRLRVGTFRIILKIEHDKLVVLVLDIDDRKSVYRKM